MRQDPWVWNRNNIHPKGTWDCYYCGGIKPDHDKGCIWEANQALLRVARAARSMLRHENSPDWKKGLIPWREIAEGVDVDDLAALAEALKEVEHLL